MRKHRFQDPDKKVLVDFPPIKPESRPVDSMAQRIVEHWTIQPDDADAPELFPLADPPCTRACPAGIDVKRYVTLIADGRFEQAAAVIRDDNPLASTCGYLCSRPCEMECTRNRESGNPVPIRALKHFVCQFIAEQGSPPTKPDRPPHTERVAVVGAGPSGLSAARDLALLGFHATVLEARPVPGGLLACEVPAFRLPPETLAQDISSIEACGVDIRCNHPVQGTSGLDRLLSAYNAVLLATGASRGLKTGLMGETKLGGVTDAMTLLRTARSGRALPSARVALVIGGSPAALAAARVLARAGGPKVYLIFPGDREQLATDPEDLKAALTEGVTLMTGRWPARILGRDGRFRGLECRKTEPQPQAGFGLPPWKIGPITEELDGDLLVAGLDREPDWDVLPPPDGVDLTPLNTVRANSETLQTGVAGLFVAGEVTTGPRGVVEAVASGRRAARAIARYLDGEGWDRLAGTPVPDSTTVPTFSGHRAQMPEESAGRSGEPPPKPATISFDPNARAIAALEHKAFEAARTCLRCGPCAVCSSCSVHCPDGLLVTDAGSMFRVAREKPLKPQELNASLLTASVNGALCKGCGRCEEACPHAAARVRFGPKRSVSEINEAFCRGCGHCAARCPTTAIAYPFLDTHNGIYPGGDR